MKSSGSVADVTAIAAGGYHSLALHADGTVTAWGDNLDGQASVPADLADVTAIAAGAAHSLALHADGTVAAWGNNAAGQASVPAGLAAVTAIAAGGYHSLALVAGDDTPPVASPTQFPAANGDGWNNTAVTVTWNWSDEDGGSGIDPAACQTTTTSTGEGARDLSASCTDLRGNTATASYTVKVDTIAPTLAPTLTPNLGGTLIAYGGDVTADPNPTDPGAESASGITSSACEAADTTTVGANSLTCTATDKADNTTNVTVDYVVGFTVTKLAPPTKMKFKAGSTIPVRFTLTGASGTPIPATLAIQLSHACAATVTLAGTPAVCASYDPTKRIFSAAVKSPKTLSVGAIIPIAIDVTVQTATIATGATSVTVTK